jgi:hypothetical protein
MDRWSGTEAAGVTDRKGAGAAARKVARRAKVAGAGVPLTSPPPLEYGVPMYEADHPVMPPEGERVKGSRGNLVWSVGVSATASGLAKQRVTQREPQPG